MKHTMCKLLAVLLCLVLLLAGCAGKETTWQEQYDLGVRYLSEGNYDEAILAFTQAIEIDSRNAEAYLSRAAAYLAVGGEEAQSNAAANYIAAADLYIEQGDSERAEQVLKEALEMMGANQQIADKLEEITLLSDDSRAHKPIFENKYYDDGTLWIEYEYDQNDELVKESWYNTDGSLQRVYEYDTNGNMIKHSKYAYTPDGALELYIITEFDAEGNIVKNSTFNSDGSLNDCWITEYDINGNKVKESRIVADGRLDYVKEYNANGNLILEMWYDYDSGSYMHIESEFDSNGNLTKEIWYDSDGTVAHVYEYDIHGNEIH